MRKLVLTALALGLVTSAPVAAQRMWQPEIGIKAGWVRADFTDAPDAADALDMFDLPGVGGIVVGSGAFVAPAPLYGIIPVGDQMAIEPSFGFQNLSISGTTITTMAVGARFNYAFTPRLYVGVGPTMYLIKLSGQEDAQGAIGAAVGYHRPVGSSFNVLAEAFYEKREKSEALSGASDFGLRIGAGALLGAKPAAAPTGHPMQSSTAMWRPSIGIQGGWSLVSIVDQGDLTFFSLPFASQSVIAGSVVVPGPSALFLILPVGQKIAIEPSFDFHHVKSEGNDAVSSYEIGARVNYAFNKAFYAGAGAEYTGLSATGIDDGTSLAVVVAAGLRFPITGALQGRTEVNYRTFDGTDIFGAGQTTAFTFGLMVPVK